MKMATKRKRSNITAKKSSKKSKKSYSAMSVKQIVMRSLETKKAAYRITNGTAYSSSAYIKTWNIMYQLGLQTPGTGPGARIGDKITVMSMNLRGLYYCTTANGPYYLRIALVGTDQYATLTDISSLMRSDLGATGWAAQTELMQFDTDKCTVYEDKVFKVDKAATVGSTQALGTNFNIDFPVSGKSVTFKGGNTAELKDRNWYLYTAVVPGFDGSSAQTSGGFLNAGLYMTFKDA